MRKIAIISLLFAGVILFAACYPLSTRQQVTQPVRSSETRTAQPEASKKLLLVTGEYAPYTSARLSGHGVFTEIVEAALKEMGVEYEIRFYPWARCEEMVLSGQAWAAFPYGMSEKIAQNYLVSSAVYPSRHTFFYLRDNDKFDAKTQNFTDIADFKDYVVGGANGYWYGTKEGLINKGILRVVWADDIYGLVRMLYNKRIDVFIEDELVGWEVIKKIYPGEEDKFATLHHAAKTSQYNLIISSTYPKSEELLDQFNAALSRMKKRGEL
ncbi:MAG: uncharacterized protein H6Q72_2608 [Firmicutes bacterium]|nr:uncharacterized protein [Bacillota bacterium]